MTKAVACGGTIASEAKGASQLSADLWGDKQKKEKELQKKRDHVNRYLLAFPQLTMMSLTCEAVIKSSVYLN